MVSSSGDIRRDPGIIRITDLAEPVRTPALQAQIENVKDVPVELTLEAVVSAAQQRTGFSNFNGDGFLRHYDVLLAAYREVPWLSNLGKIAIFEFCTNFLSNRLKMEELYRRHPEIDEVDLEAPIIITGLPRSGTTHLHNLIFADGRFRGLHYYEAGCPVPDSIDVTPVSLNTDPRYHRCKTMIEERIAKIPYFEAMRGHSPEYLHEEIDLLAMEGLTAQFETLAPIPEYRDYLRDVDNTDAYLYVRKSLKALSWLRGPRRWVLKSPQHNGFLPALNRVFPDAVLVFTHRDPSEVVASMATMVAYTHRIGFEKIDTASLGEYWMEHCEYYLKKLVQDRNIISPDRSVDIHFSDFLRDKIKYVQHIFDKAGLTTDEEVLEKLRKYINANPRSQRGKVVYDIEADFGISPRAIRERFGFYMELFDVSWEE